MNPFSRARLERSALRHLHPALRYLSPRLRRMMPRSGNLGSVFLTVFFLSLFAVLLGIIVIYFLYIAKLPSITTIEAETLPESTIIYDRKGNELYNLYTKEKRTYVGYSQISPYMVHAIVSTEDKNFFENSGLELRSFFRSGYNYIVGKTDRVQGTSTLSQQLIKNVFFSNERSWERKIKEAYLSYMLNEKYSKEKILEIYLNKIGFGSNAYGIEQASETFFGKPASALGPLGSAILASLPKGPTYYSPYNARDRLMGEMEVYPTADPTSQTVLSSPESFATYRPFVEAFKGIVANLSIAKANDKLKVCNLSPLFLKNKHPLVDGCLTIDPSDLLSLLGDIRIAYADIAPAKINDNLVGYAFEYTTGRKDFVLGRMLEDGYITPEEYKKAVIGGLEFTFAPYRENITYPYFIFYLREYIEEHYGKSLLEDGGLRIYTTLDPSLQDKAEELVKKQAAINARQYGARDAALLSIDNKSGQILAMVGGVDYFDESREGAHVNVITSKRQPGSSFKPIVYSLAISREPIGPDTPIYDLKTTFGNWTPDNYDRQFYGRMPLKKALGYSRNIPAAKMFYAAGGESDVVDYAQSLGIASLQHGNTYGAPLAIGAGELKPIELTQAYSVFANGGYKIDITPILKISDSRGNILSQYTPSAGKQVLSDSAAYIITSMLSDDNNRPTTFWKNALTLSDGRPAAAKTGTSNKDESHGSVKKIVPRDLWTAGYTPQMTTVVWAGNINGDGTLPTCDGLNCAAPIWKGFMDFAHQGLPTLDFARPDSLHTATISTISGKLAGTSTPDEFRVSSIFAVAPTDYDTTGKEVQVDSLCNGKVTADTPPAAIRTGLFANPTPIIEAREPTWLPQVRSWIADHAGDYAKNSNFIFSMSDEACARPKGGSATGSVILRSNLTNGSDRSFGKNTVEISYESNYPLVRIEALHNGKSFIDVPLDEKTSGTYVDDGVSFDDSFAGKQTITLRATDKYSYVTERTLTINVIRNTKPPEITLTRPAEGILPRIKKTDAYTIQFTVSDLGEINAANLYVDGKLYKILGGDTRFSVDINQKGDIAPGIHAITVEAIDADFNKSSKNFTIEVSE